MKNKLLQILKNKKNKCTISSLISPKNNHEIYDWIVKQTKKYKNISLSERIYIILNKPPSCKKAIFKRYDAGYTFCGNKNECQCKKEHYKNIREEAGKKRQKTNLKKYGVKFNSQIEEVKNKKFQTCMKNFGVMTNLLHEDTIKKSKQTNFKKYGTEYPAQNPGIKEKTRKTNIEKYGENYTLFIDREKFTDTMNKRYGVDHALQSSDIQERKKQTNIERYGVEFPQILLEIKEKIKQTNIERYGVPHLKQKHLSSEAIDFVNDDNRFIKEYNEKGFQNIKDQYSISSQIVRARCKKLGLEYELNLTQIELIIFNLLKECIETEIKIRDRTTIKPLEIDFLLPELNLGIEICGLRWHSELSGKKDKKYHYNKYERCKRANIRLLTIFEDEIENKFNIIKNRIQHSINHNKSICGARNTYIKKIDNKIGNTFFNKYHIQGSIPSTITYGAYYNNELVSCMSFGHKRMVMGNKTKNKNEYEMLRFATMGNIPGIASKLFKTFIKDYSPEIVISYCDLRWGTGGLYKKLGFDFSHISPPSYWYIDSIGRNRYHRSKFMKHLLVKEGYDPKKTEWQIMVERKFDRIWDCGNSVWIYKNNI